jgi:hypothetical protein
MLDHGRVRHSRRTLLGVLLLSVLPWSVFLLAGVDYYPLDAVAILLPVLVAVLVLVVLVVAARRRDPRWLVPAVSLLVVGLLAVCIRWLPADAGAVRPDARVSVLGANVVRIDHILVSRGWCGDGAGQVALPGSDHRGVLATVGPCLPAATP